MIQVASPTLQIEPHLCTMGEQRCPDLGLEGEVSSDRDFDHGLSVREGDVIAEKYRVERVLGAGGMGVVVAARHLFLDEKVAIKFLRPGMLADRELVSRFEREARTAVRIKNEHVARVLDVGTLPDGAPYIVMEFLEGCDLSDWLTQRGPLPIEQAIDFVLQASVAIADAHGIGIVHRDLKPANMFCVPRNDGNIVVKVLDFGISKVTGAATGAGLSMTATATMMGSPIYMSPEQMRSAKEVDARADQWSLGVILFEILTGRPPFLGETFADVAVRVATEAPPPMRSLRPEVPAGLESVILRCLAKNRTSRYAHVGELAVALARVRRSWRANARRANLRHSPKGWYCGARLDASRRNASATRGTGTVQLPALPFELHTVAPMVTSVKRTASRRRAILVTLVGPTRRCARVRSSVADAASSRGSRGHPSRVARAAAAIVFAGAATAIVQRTARRPGTARQSSAERTTCRRTTSRFCQPLPSIPSSPPIRHLPHAVVRIRATDAGGCQPSLDPYNHRRFSGELAPAAQLQPAFHH